MTAEMRQPRAVSSEKIDASINGESVERSSLLEKFETTYAEFKTAFNWPAQEVDELFDRVAGSNGDVSETLGRRMFDLFMKGRESSFVQDDKRKVYKVIFEKFTRESLDTQTIRESLVLNGDPIDETYVPLHLLIVLEQLSRHEE